MVELGSYSETKTNNLPLNNRIANGKTAGQVPVSSADSQVGCLDLLKTLKDHVNEAEVVLGSTQLVNQLSPFNF